MEHVVFYQSAQGAPAFRRVASLEDAVSFAEHLRNIEGVTDFSVYSMSPVTLSMRAYYHVEVSGADAVVAAQEPAPASVPDPGSPFAAAPGGQPQVAATPPPLPDAPPLGAPLEAASAAPSMSFNALEEEASTPTEELPAPTASMPFAAAPLPPAGGGSSIETFVKDDPADLPSADANDPSPVDPTVVDPTTEEVVPSPPSGRRSMGFFARS
jgi:hypothetical protein